MGTTYLSDSFARDSKSKPSIDESFPTIGAYFFSLVQESAALSGSVYSFCSAKISGMEEAKNVMSEHTQVICRN